MKRFLIRICLIAGVTGLASCSYFQQGQDEETPQDPATTKNATAPQKTEATPALPGYPPPPTLRLNPLPNVVQEESDRPLYMPGDDRPGLRAPKLPNILPYNMDGKLTTPAAQ